MKKRDLVLVTDPRGYSAKEVGYVQKYLQEKGIEARTAGLKFWEFGNDETKPELDGDVDIEGCHCFWWNDSTLHPDTWAWRSMMALENLIEHGAGKIDYAAAYLCNSRQDKKKYKAEEGKVVPKTIATAITYAKHIRPYLDGLITLDLHADRIRTEGYPGVAFLDLQSTYLFANYIKSQNNGFRKDIENGIARVACTDNGREKASAELARLLGIDRVVGRKIRDERGKLKKCEVIGDVKGKIILTAEDMIDSGLTAEYFIEDAKNKGAKEVHFFAGHGIFSNEAVEKRLYNADGIYVTDSLRQTDPRVVVVSCLDLVAEAVKFRIEGKNPRNIKEIYDSLNY